MRFSPYTLSPGTMFLVTRASSLPLAMKMPACLRGLNTHMARRTQIKLFAACKSRCCRNNDPIHATKSQHRQRGGTFPELSPTCAPRWRPWLLLSYLCRLLQRRLAHHRGPRDHLGRRGHHPCRRRGRQSLRPHNMSHACGWANPVEKKFVASSPSGLHATAKLPAQLVQAGRMQACRQGACWGAANCSWN